jgi:hexosaminidase
MLGLESHYLNDPCLKIILPRGKARVLGGEAAMWSELVTPLI